MTIAVKAVQPLPRSAGNTRQHSGRFAKTPPPSEHLAWRQPVAGLWVAETPSAYLGMIEVVETGFRASAADGRTLGDFDAVADAKVAVYASWFRRQEPNGFLRWAQRLMAPNR